MHMEQNRLLVFARKPAPVQVTYLAYCSTTGLKAIDYRLSDPYLDPPGQGDEFYAEATVRLPQGYWCYQPPFEMPPPTPLPARDADFVTFGCLNNFCKVTDVTLRTWCRLMREVPTSRLMLHTHEGAHRQWLIDFFAREDIEAKRIQFVGFHALGEYTQIYRKIDIGLDPFPYNGGTTTCDAMWMGVPVVTLAGRTSVSRSGLSLLSNIGLPELVARSEDDYVKIARELANDLPRLSDLRANLRQRMRGSPLMDAPAFARGVESAYRQMWRQWCGR
jgi:predicted O-linked N-acetylglucosamine transferase (SPINDLY family)